MKKTLLIALALLLSCSAVSCSDNKPSESDGNKANESAPAQSDTVETEPPSEYELQQAVDYEGWKMVIATGGPEWTNGFFNNILVSDLTGDVFNDAIFNRQTAVQDKYNVKITEEYNLEVTDVLIKSVSANTADYAIGYQCFTDEINGFVDNVFIGASDMPVFDFSKPWWDQTVV